MEFSIDWQLPVFRGGKDIAVYKSAKFFSKAASENYISTRENTIILISNITRENLEKTLDMTMYNRVKQLSQVADELNQSINGYRLPKGYSIKMSGTIADMKDSMPRVLKAVLLGFVFLIVLLIFESFTLPLPILIAIPLSVMVPCGGFFCTQNPCACPP